MITRRQLLWGLLALPGAARQAQTWLFLGDSITAAPGSYASLFQAKRAGDTVVNAAQTGSGAYEVRAALETLLPSRKPDVVSIMVGANDCLAGPTPDGMKTYKYNLKLALKLAAGKRVILHTPPPIDLKKHPQRRAIAQYAQFVRDLARVSGVQLVDHWPMWAANHGVQRWLTDGLHPNAKGQQALLKRMLAVVK